MSKAKNLTIEVPVTEMGNDLFLHEKIGDIDYGGMKASLHRTVPGSSFVVHVDGDRYLVEAADICRSVLDKLKD